MVGPHQPGFRGLPRPRLAPEDYGRPGAICSVTTATGDRRPVFADPALAAAVVDVLRARAAATGVPVYAYCIMPDHVHLVLAPSPACDIPTFVGQLKDLAQRAA